MKWAIIEVACAILAGLLGAMIISGIIFSIPMWLMKCFG